MERRTEISIILPLYNPHEGWKENFHQALANLDKLLVGVRYQIVIVNDGSTRSIDEDFLDDLTAKHKEVTYLAYPINKGKGGAVRFGLAGVESNYYIYSDFDFPFGYQAIRDTYDLLKTNKVGLVIAKRDEHYYRILPFVRKILSRSLQIMNYFLTGFKVLDTQAGLKGLNEVAKDIFLTTKTTSFIFEVEFIRKAIKKGIPYQYLDVRPKVGIQLTNFGMKTIKKEVKSLLKILSRK